MADHPMSSSNRDTTANTHPLPKNVIRRHEASKWRAGAELALDRTRTTARIIHALVLREIMTRFGRENMGFIWLVLEPLILTALVMFAWTLMYGTTKHGVTVVQIVLSGYSMVTLWRHMVGRFSHCFKHNAGLMFHRNVKPFDAIIARFILETLGTLLSFVIAYVALYLTDMIAPMHDVYLMVIAWFLMAFFSFSVALILAACQELWEHTEKFVQPLMYVTLPLTGLFFMVSWIPSDYRYIFLLSPIIHCVEMFRAGLIGPSVEAFYDTGFVLVVTVFMTAFALLLMRKAEANIRIE